VNLGSYLYCHTFYIVQSSNPGIEHNAANNGDMNNVSVFIAVS
jgi:hypothetical protein